MSFKGYVSLAFAFLSIASCNKKSTNNTNPSAQFNQYLTEQTDLFQEQFTSEQPGIILAIYSPDTCKVFASGMPDGNVGDMHFRGASTTKSLTAAAVMLLYQQGKLDIDDYVTDIIPGNTISYLPNTALYNIPHKSDITIKQLLGHRAGVFDLTNADVPDSIGAPYAGDRYVDYLFEQYGEYYTIPLDSLVAPLSRYNLSFFEPGTAFHYSNTGYHLLARIVERVSGMELAAFQQVNLLDKLKLQNSYFEVDGMQTTLPEPAFPCYLKMNGAIMSGAEENLSSAIADGNIVTTVKDLAKWGYTLWGTNDILNKEMIDLMEDCKATGDVNVSYGLGTSNYPEDLGFGHTGVRKAFMTYLRYNPKTQKSYVVMSNGMNVDNFEGEEVILLNIMRKAVELDL